MLQACRVDYLLRQKSADRRNRSKVGQSLDYLTKINLTVSRVINSQPDLI